jgi:hypothetical protein
MVTVFHCDRSLRRLLVRANNGTADALAVRRVRTRRIRVKMGRFKQPPTLILRLPHGGIREVGKVGRAVLCPPRDAVCEVDTGRDV